MWKLSKKDKSFLEFLDNTSQETIDSIPDEGAVFMPYMTEEEYTKAIEREQKEPFLKKFYESTNK